MRYFSFALRCKTIGNFNQRKRFISYKTRINLVSTLNNIMNEFEASEGMGLRSAALKNQHCTFFAVNVLANGASGSKSICVQSDLLSYLFNCGEGMQRLAMEHKQKIAKTKTVFITYHSWSNIGGIMGLCLTLQGQGVKQVVIYGPAHIKEMILGLRLFVAIKSLTLIFVTDQPRLQYDDSVFKVQFVPIYPDPSKNVDRTTSEANVTRSPKKQEENSDSDTEEPSRKRRCQSESRAGTNACENYALCYICVSPEFGMHLDVEKCLKLGVPCGPMLGVLKSKNDVKLPDGTVVHWEDVFKNTGKRETFLVVECPTEDFLDTFVNEPEFVRFQGSPQQPATLIIHFTEPEIMNTAKYLEWMSRFPPMTKHMKVNSSNRVIDHVDCYRLQEKLNFLDPEIFPKLNEDNIPEVKEEYSNKYNSHLRVVARVDDSEPMKESNIDTEENECINSNELLKPGFYMTEELGGIKIISPFSTLRWTICPQMKDKFSHFLYLDRKKCLNEIDDINNIREQVEELKELKMNWMASKECNALPDYPKILFLGTGSSTPYSFRNTSAILVEFEEGHLVLLDCGEGTYGQLLRFFGKEKIQNILKRLRMIYVSHQHADHHLGLINLLDARYKILSTCKREDYMNGSYTAENCHLVMILPSSVRDWVHVSNKFKTLLYDARILVSSSTLKSYNTLRRCTNNIGVTNFKTVTVPHSYESFGVAFIAPNGYKITYSGDAMPSDNLVELGRQCDLLIHEATFEDGMEVMAKNKKHSTVSQALNIGKRMQANFTMLTHFSQRYSHLPQLSLEFPENAGIAFDNMLVTPKTLPFLTRLMKFYKMIFADKLVQLNSKTVKRMLREENEKPKESLRMKV